jgi:hypothetical protein
MRKQLSFILISFLFFANAKAQNGIDNTWIMGGPSLGGSMNLDFISGIPNTYTVNRSMNISTTNALISDTTGNILFYTNGCYIANALDDTMFNGSGLNPGACANSFCATGNEVEDGAIILPDPGNANRYYLFHENCDVTTPNFGPSGLFYSVIDISLQGNLGEVIQKNILLLSSNLNWGFLTACRHANGRDWWVVAHNFNGNLFYTFLLNPLGVQGPFTQFIGPINNQDGYGQTVFSSDGTKLATSTWGGGSFGAAINLFDFDRCSGLFSNPYHISLMDSIGGSGVAFSPNSRFLYVSAVDSIIQYDVTASNILSTQTKVATFDSIYCFTNRPESFLLMQLAYDHKIYITTGGGCPSLHIINFPDSSGIACDILLHNFTLPDTAVVSLPNYPNYRLGPVIGSLCDSITGINEENGFQYKLKVYPNPSKEIFHFQFNDIREQIKSLEITDVTGRTVYTINKNVYEINLSSVVNGIYFYSVQTKKGRVFKGKLVKEQ